MDPKNEHQHYLPQSLLRGFTDGDGLVWRFDRKDGRCVPLPPSVIGGENNLYSIVSNGTQSQVLERRFMHEIDGPFPEIARKLHRNAPLSLGETDKLATFVSILICRSPAKIRETETRFRQIDRLVGPNPEQVRYGVPPRDEGRRPTEEARTTRYTLVDEQVDAVSPTRAELEQRTAVLRTLFKVGLDCAMLLHELRWSILRSPAGRCFIVGDDPGIIVGGDRDHESSGVGLMAPGAVTYVPLSSQMCLRLSSPIAGPKQLHSSTIDGTTVRLLNRAQVHNSERFLHSPSRALMVSLTKGVSCGLNHAVLVLDEAQSDESPQDGLIHLFTRRKIPPQLAAELCRVGT